MENPIVQKAEKFVANWFNEKLPETLHYHNAKHTTEVVEHVYRLAEAAGVAELQLEIMVLAAWFHDTGYALLRQGHEAESARIAQQFLEQQGYQAEHIETVKRLILVTEMSQQPEGELEKIIRDADMAHVGSKKYFKKLKKLRKEWVEDQNRSFTDAEWMAMNYDFLQKHQFYTPQAIKLFGPQKEENLNQTLELLNQANAEASEAPEIPMKTSENKKAAGQEEPVAKKKKSGSERGIESMFRITMKNHIQLSQIADNKANIMLSINSIIISIVLTVMVPQIEDRPALLVPSLLLLLFSVISVVLATVSTIPKVNRGNVTRQQIESKEANLLFFGNFYNMSLPDYDWGMKYMMEAPDYLYSSMIKDLYFLGKVLHRKYMLLRLTYGTFMFGTVISVISFLVALSLEA